MLCVLIAIYKFFVHKFFTFHGLLLLCLITASLQLEEKQRSLSSIEAKLRESEKNLGESNKEKDIIIKSLQEQVRTLYIMPVVSQ